MDNKTLKKARKTANNDCYKVSRQYHPSIPISTIDGHLRAVGLKLIDEAGSDWSGLFCGAQGDCVIDVATVEGQKVPFLLALQWYKRNETGRYEINCYLS